MYYHGNYCGPGWSDGKYQTSVIGKLPGVDEFDDTCKQHDATYASTQIGLELSHADFSFYQANIGQGLKRSLAAMAVGIQGLLRGNDSSTPNTFTMPKQNLRGAVAPSNNSKRGAGAPPNNRKQVAMPNIIGTTVKGSATRTLGKTDDTLHMATRVCIGRPVSAFQSAIVETNGLLYLNPISLGSDEVQNMVRVYQHFRIKSARIEYTPFVSTSVGGEIIIVSDSDPNFKPPDTASATTFYQRAMSTQHSLMAPTWMPESMELSVDPAWKICDNANSTTLEEFCSGVVYTFVDGTTSVPGLYSVDLDIEFKGLRFNPRAVISGSLQGYGVRRTFSFVAPVLNGDAVAVVTVGTFTPGDIYSVVLTATSGAFGAGSPSTLFNLTSGSGLIPMVIDGAQAFYLRASTTSSGTLFATYDAAVGSDNSDKVVFAITAAGTTSLFGCATQLRNSSQANL